MLCEEPSPPPRRAPFESNDDDALPVGERFAVMMVEDGVAAPTCSA